MASVLKVDKLDPQSGTALEIGTSGDTVTVPTGAGLTVTDEVKTNKVSPATGTAFALGDSGDTFTVPSGATLDISASTLTPPATMPASSGINLTALNATNLGSGTVPTARLGTGTASSSVFLAGDNTWAAPGGGIDCDADAWQYRLSGDLDQDSGAVIDWEGGAGSPYHLGSNVTESGGVFTVSTAGWYYLECCLSNNASTTDPTEVYFRKNSSNTSLRMLYYIGASDFDYGGQTMSCIVEAAATNTFDMYGSGNWYGSNSTVGGSYFLGIRLGA